MVLCPVAMAVGCSKCPVVKVCPLKSSLGDFRPEPPAAAARPAPAPKRKPTAKAQAARKPASRKPGGKR